MISFGDGLWIEQAPHSFMGLRVGARMTLVRLAGGELLLHSPLALTDARRSEVDALGTLTHIVAPSAYHHVYAAGWADAYPRAVVHGPEELRTKNTALRLDRPLSDGAHADWAGTLEPVAIDGCLLRETVFIHTPSRTLVSCDLVENQNEVDHLPTRVYLQLSGAYRRIAWPRPLRLLYRDKAAARRSVERILEHDIERAIIAHGDVITRDLKPSLRSALAFLGVA